MALNMAIMALGIAVTLPTEVSSGRAVAGPTMSRYGMASAQIGCRLSSSFSSMGVAPTMRRSLSALEKKKKTEQKINGIISEYTKEDISIGSSTQSPKPTPTQPSVRFSRTRLFNYWFATARRTGKRGGYISLYLSPTGKISGCG